MDIASADIRESLSEGKEVAHMLPKAVEMYIRQKGLYDSKDRTAKAQER